MHQNSPTRPTRRPLAIRLGTLALCTAAALASANASAQVLRTSDFESGDFTSYGWVASGNPPQIASKSKGEPTCTGQFSVKFPLSRDSGTSYRTELSMSNTNAPPIKNLQWGKDYWIGFAVYLPSDWKPDNQAGDTLLQLHGVPDDGEAYRTPPLAFSVEGSSLQLTYKWDSRAIMATPDNRNGIKYEGWQQADLGPYQTGRWTSIVLHFKATYNANGFVELWRDGKKVYSKTGVGVGYNDKTGVYIKVGNYKRPWAWGPTDVSYRLHYLDDFRVADGSSSYAEVAPQCGTSAGQPSPVPAKPTGVKILIK